MKKRDQNNLTERQSKLLQLIIENYTETAEAVSSISLIKEFGQISSATIRNEFSELEKMGYITKEHTSSGRIPTKKGYQYFIHFIMETEIEEDENDIILRLKKVFQNSSLSIEQTLDETAKLVSHFINLPIVINRTSTTENELLKKIDIVNISEQEFMIYIITSNSNILKHFIQIENSNQAKDIETCIRIFNEKMLNLPIQEIKDKIELIIKEIENKVYEYQFIFNKIISEIILKIQENLTSSEQKIYNSHSIINLPEIQKNKIKLEDVLEVLENCDVFNQIEYNYKETGKTFINLDDSGVAVASTKIQEQGQTHQISIVGPSRMDYLKIKQILGFLNEKLSKK